MPDNTPDFISLALPIVQKIVFALIVLIVGLLIIKGIVKFLNRILDKKHVDPTLRPFLKSTVSVGLKALLIVAIVGILDIPTASFVALFGAVGLAIGLAFQGSLSNFAGGVLILVTRPFKVGDYIDAAGQSGTVEAIQILYTELVSLDNKVIRIPNGSLSNASVTNYSEKPTRRVDLQFTAAYEADTDKVIGVLTSIAMNHPKVFEDPAPFVRMSEHGDSAVTYTVRVWVNSADYWDVYFDVIETVKKRFDEAAISIPYPQLDVRVSQPE